MPFRNSYRVRYVECDQQGVVFNAWYQVYMDDSVDVWTRKLDPHYESQGWELMLKRLEIVWHSPARFNETLTIECEVARWGTSSFDVNCRGLVGDRHCIDGTMVYVVVDNTEHRPRPVPRTLKEHLSLEE